MSISGAVAELNKEIERLTKIRDSLLQGSPSPSVAQTESTLARKGAASKKASSAKKAASAKKVTPAKKRTLSPEARKRISDATKARWAAARKAKSAK